MTIGFASTLTDTPPFRYLIEPVEEEQEAQEAAAAAAAPPPTGADADA